MTMKLSILSNTYNNLGITKLYLPNMITSCGVADREVIINDNSDTTEVANMLRLEVKPDTLLIHGRNIGNPQGMNKILPLAKGEYIAKIDPDFIMPQNWAAIGIDILERHPDVGMVGYHWARLLDHPDLYIGEDMGEYYLPKKIFGVWVFRRSLLAEVGLFRDDMSKYGLWDSEFQARVRNNGYKCVYAKTPELCHHKGRDTPEHREFKNSELRKAGEKVTIDENYKIKFYDHENQQTK